MQFVKTHWISLASGLVALIAIATTVFGMTRKSVVEAMNKRVADAAEIDSLKNSPRNQESIEAEKEKGRQFEEQYKATVDAAAAINRREPLLEGVFPPPKTPQLELAYRFQEMYKDKLYQLPQALQAGGPPGDQEIQDEMERLSEQSRRRWVEQGGEEGGGAAPPTEPTPGGGAAVPGAPVPGAGLVKPGGGQFTAPAAAQSKGPPAVDPLEARRLAAVRKAHSIRVYAEANPARSSFHVSPIVLAERAPSPSEMWCAQVELWVQGDLVSAIRKLNDEAAAQLPEDQVFVANLPVKRILGVRVFGYVNTAGNMVRFESLNPSTSGTVVAGGIPDFANPSFTGRKSDASFDVVRFAIAVIVDQRDLLRLVDYVTRENFYQLVGIQYEAGPPGGQDGDYFYGEAPTVRAILDFEGYMARSVYEKWMPEDVKKALSAEGQSQQP